MKIVLSSDHAGHDLKLFLSEKLTELGHETLLTGAKSASLPASYVPASIEATELLNTGQAEYGIFICGTGIGISIAANKQKGIRAALCTNEFMAALSRKHNNANVLCLGARLTAPLHAWSIVETFLANDFEGQRHEVRVNEINNLDRGEI